MGFPDELLPLGDVVRKGVLASHIRPPPITHCCNVEVVWADPKGADDYMSPIEIIPDITPFHSLSMVLYQLQ
jgi:hypothetical protein